MEGSPAKKQKQTTPMAITPPPLKRSYAAVVRNNINSSNNNLVNSKKMTLDKVPIVKEKTPIIIEAGLGNPNPKGVNPPSGVKHSKSSNSATSQHVIGEDVHPYLRQLEQALELEVKYRVPVGDNPQGEMSGGITSGMRDGSAHVLRCLKV